MTDPNHYSSQHSSSEYSQTPFTPSETLFTPSNSLHDRSQPSLPVEHEISDASQNDGVAPGRGLSTDDSGYMTRFAVHGSGTIEVPAFSLEQGHHQDMWEATIDEQFGQHIQPNCKVSWARSPHPATSTSIHGCGADRTQIEPRCITTREPNSTLMMLPQTSVLYKPILQISTRASTVFPSSTFLSRWVLHPAQRLSGFLTPPTQHHILGLATCCLGGASTTHPRTGASSMGPPDIFQQPCSMILWSHVTTKCILSMSIPTKGYASTCLQLRTRLIRLLLRTQLDRRFEHQMKGIMLPREVHGTKIVGGVGGVAYVYKVGRMPNLGGREVYVGAVH